MANVAENLSELIGNTPLLRLKKFEKKGQAGTQLLGKLEVFNPGGSIKDRIAKEMIDAAEADGRLKPGGTIIEGTSGNTGVGLAAQAAARGYKAIIVMPENMSHERVTILKAFGAEVVLTPAKLNMGGAGARAQEILKETEGAVLMGQGSNPGNPGAHYKTTGPEIYRDTEGEVDILVATVGTGGTISGAGRYLREQNPDVKIIGVEPAGCPVLSGGEPGPHKIQGIGGGMITPVTDMELMDEIITVTDDDAYDTARESAREEGLLIGISAGAALWAAVEVAKREENAGKKIVVILPDSGERYLSTDLFE